MNPTYNCHLGYVAAGGWLLDHPNCPRCGLPIHRDDPIVGYHPSDPGLGMRLKHATSTATDQDGCVVALGRRVMMLERLLQSHYHGRMGICAGVGGLVAEAIEDGRA